MRIESALIGATTLVCLLAACTTVGPAAIRSGRIAYNEAIAETNQQQMLMAIIHNRYGEQSSLLGVSSITASVSFSAATDVQLGLGNSKSYAGNLVPLGASASYEENPTISYTPAAGEQYLQQLMSPVPLAALARLAGSALDPVPIYGMLVASVNGIRNPGFLFPSHLSSKTDPRFSRLATLMATLSYAQVLHWVDDPRHPGGFAIYLHHYAPESTAEVDEMLRLLGLETLSASRKQAGASLLIPVTLALDHDGAQGIALTTRSVYRLVEILSAAVALPAADSKLGIVRAFPPLGSWGSQLRINWSQDRPEHAAVAVKHRNGWFYIAGDDLATKQFFRLLTTLWSVTVAESNANGASRPVLTLPVGN